jgi:hypothetical protein
MRCRTDGLVFNFVNFGDMVRLDFSMDFIIFPGFSYLHNESDMT